MKIFRWMRNKLIIGKENGSKSISNQTNEEFSDWPNGLFCIGTFGNNSSEKTAQAIFVEVDDNNYLNEDEIKNDKDEQLSTSLVHSVEKDINKNGIGRRSLSFLLKKALVFSPDPKSDRLDKILRAILHKKIYPQKPMKKYLGMDLPGNDRDDQDEHEKASYDSKWDKTDSEYIVLEI